MDDALVQDMTSFRYYYEKTSENTFFLLRTETDEAGVERISRCIEGIIDRINHSVQETEIQELTDLQGARFLEVNVEQDRVTISCETDEGDVDVKWDGK